MAIIYQKDVQLSKLSTFRMGALAHNVVLLETEDDIKSFFTDLSPNLKWFVLGGGSNIIFPENDCETTIIRLMDIKIDKLNEDKDSAVISVGSGAIWDDVVKYAVENNYSGIEALSAIPGTAGATPVQNVGAYGREIADVLESVRVYDTQTNDFKTLLNEECDFGYRDSIFKHEGKGRYIIVSITLKLFKDEPDVPQYLGVSEYFAARGIQRPSLSQIREAITNIRWQKLPNPAEIASVGSFFKNAYVTEEYSKNLVEKFPDIKIFPEGDGWVKVPTGWLIEKAGFKGQRFGNISVFKNNALVLVNEGGATRTELVKVIETIVTEVKNKFGIDISPEPELLNLD